METDILGTKRWYKNDLLHRDNDLPAIEYASGDKFWYQNNLIHRDNDLPAIEWDNGDKWWHQNDLLHRDNDLPAVEWANGDKRWYQFGLRHRDNDLPAAEYISGYKCWFKSGVEYTPKATMNCALYTISNFAEKNHLTKEDEIYLLCEYIDNAVDPEYSEDLSYWLDKFNKADNCMAL